MARGHLSCAAREQEFRFCSAALVFASLPRASPLTGALAPVSPLTYRTTGTYLNAAAPQWLWHVSCRRVATVPCTPALCDRAVKA
jgi:hypothetical protein